MAKLKYFSLEQIIRFFLEQGKEGVCWDFKQEWHKNIEDLLKDIICFSNTVHDEKCYLIFGVSDDLRVTGMEKPRKTQSNIIDAISKLSFAGDIYPKIELRTIKFEEKLIDVLIIDNVEETPIYLKRQYGKMRAGCIYSRIEDRNTPDNSNADIKDIEMLWKKRLGLTKTPLEYIYDRMHNKLEWKEENNVVYNIYKPEYNIEISNDLDDLDDEFYAYVMSNHKSTYKVLEIKHMQTVLESYQLVLLDGGKLSIPTPEWGFICHNEYGMDPLYSYKYYIEESKRYSVLSFMYDNSDGDQRDAFHRLKKVVLFYKSEEEKLAFESYIESHPEIINKSTTQENKYFYIDSGNDMKNKLYRERLQIGTILTDLLEKWRQNKI